MVQSQGSAGDARRAKARVFPGRWLPIESGVMISLKAARFPKDGLLHQAPRLLLRTASGARAMPPRSLLWSRRFSHISAVPSPRRENLLTFMKHGRLIRRCGNLAICYPQGEKGHGQNTSHCLVTTRSPNQLLGTGNGKERGPARVATRSSEIQGAQYAILNRKR